MTQLLVVSAGDLDCAFPLGDVLETMRPLPTRRLDGMHAWTRGFAIIRGRPTPVLDLTAIVQGTAAGQVTRYVALRAGARPLALAVERVLGVRRVPESSMERLAPVTAPGRREIIEGIGAIEDGLLVVLHADRLLPAPLLQRAPVEETTP